MNITNNSILSAKIEVKRQLDLIEKKKDQAENSCEKLMYYIYGMSFGVKDIIDSKDIEISAICIALIKKIETLKLVLKRSQKKITDIEKKLLALFYDIDTIANTERSKKIDELWAYMLEIPDLLDTISLEIYDAIDETREKGLQYK